MSDPFAYWRKAVAGEDVSDWPADVYAGYWRHRGVPVIVEPNAEGALWARVYDEPPRPADDSFREQVFGWAAADPVTPEQVQRWQLTGVWHDQEPAAVLTYECIEDEAQALCEAARQYVPLDDDRDEIKRAEHTLSALYATRRKLRDLDETIKEWTAALREEVRARGGKVRP